MGSQPAAPTPSEARASAGTSTVSARTIVAVASSSRTSGICSPRSGTTTSISSSGVSPPASSSAIALVQPLAVEREVGGIRPQPAQEDDPGELGALAGIRRDRDPEFLEVRAGQLGRLDRGARRSEGVELEERRGMVADEALGQRYVPRQRRAIARLLDVVGNLVARRHQLAEALRGVRGHRPQGLSNNQVAHGRRFRRATALPPLQERLHAPNRHWAEFRCLWTRNSAHFTPLLRLVPPRAQPGGRGEPGRWGSNRC